MAHWYVVGAHPERLAEIRQAGHLVDAFGGPLDATAQTDLWKRLTHAAPDGLWITWAALQPPNLEALRRLRVAQPTLHMVIELPADLTPPNPDLAQVVGLGIYALVPESSDFTIAARREYTFTDAAPWQGPVRTFDDPERVTDPSQDRVIARRTVLVASPAKPVVIVVVGTHPGVGVSSVAVHLANTLADAGHATVLTEAQDTETYGLWPGPIHADRAPSAPPVDDLVAFRRWSYIVLDAGAYRWEAVSQADLVVVVGPGALHQRHHWQHVVKRFAAAARAHPALLRVALVRPSPTAAKTVEWLNEQWAALEGSIGIFVEADGVWPRVLAPVLPAESARRRGWWLSRRSHARPHRPFGTGSTDRRRWNGGLRTVFGAAVIGWLIGVAATLALAHYPDNSPNELSRDLSGMVRWEHHVVAQFLGRHTPNTTPAITTQQP